MRNTLTHRIHGEFPRGSVEIGLSGAAADGDRFRLTALRDQTAYVGIHRNGSAYTIVAVQNITIDEWSGDSVARARTSSLAAPPGCGSGLSLMPGLPGPGTPTSPTAPAHTL